VPTRLPLPIRCYQHRGLIDLDLMNIAQENGVQRYHPIWVFPDTPSFTRGVCAPQLPRVALTFTQPADE
jgi:hypothetical protein